MNPDPIDAPHSRKLLEKHGIAATASLGIEPLFERQPALYSNDLSWFDSWPFCRPRVESPPGT
jgi:hypothetical protein